MGSVWLTDLPEVLRAAGLNVQTWPGWETRSRSSGGYDKVLAIGIHHDAGAAGSSLNSRCTYAWENASDRPIGAIWLHTDGTVMIGASGATNTQGKGGPQPTSKGTIPLDQGNKFMISIEASNNGVGEPWPSVMQQAYVKLCAALCERYGLTAGDVVAHFEWTDRKIDPAGPSKYATGSNEWDMNEFRSDVWTEMTEPVPEPGPDPGPTPPEEEPLMLKLVLKDVRNPSNQPTYICGPSSKSWVRDWDTYVQIEQRLAESKNGTVPSPWDGMTYKLFEHAGKDVIASYGPIVGPRPPGVDEYGR